MFLSALARKSNRKKEKFSSLRCPLRSKDESNREKTLFAPLSAPLERGKQKNLSLTLFFLLFTFSRKTQKNININTNTQELDSTNPKILHEPSRIWRVAQGAGCHPDSVAELVGEYMRMRATIVGNKGQGGLMKTMSKSMGSRGGPNPQQMAQMQQHVS